MNNRYPTAHFSSCQMKCTVNMAESCMRWRSHCTKHTCTGTPRVLFKRSVRNLFHLNCSSSEKTESELKCPASQMFLLSSVILHVSLVFHHVDVSDSFQISHQVYDKSRSPNELISWKALIWMCKGKGRRNEIELNLMSTFLSCFPEDFSRLTSES